MRMKALVAVLVFVCIGLQAQTTASTSDGKTVVLYPNGTWVFQGEESKENFQFLDSGSTPLDSAGYGTVFAKVRNNTPDNYFYVAVNVDFYLKGKLVGNEGDAVHDFLPGTIRNVKVMVNQKFDKYELSLDLIKKNEN